MSEFRRYMVLETLEGRTAQSAIFIHTERMCKCSYT